MTDPLHLNGLDGANPLGFLAALGTLALCDRLGLHPRMGWKLYANSYRPQLYVDDASDLAEQMTDVLKADLANGPPAWCEGTVIKRPASQYRDFTSVAASQASLSNRHAAQFAAAYASEVATEDDKPDAAVMPTRYSFSNGQSGKILLRDYRDLVTSLTPRHIEESLYHPWQNTDACKTFRWEPRDLRLYALRAENPGASTVYSTLGANVLAFWALTLLPSFPTAQGELINTGFARLTYSSQTGDYFSWPIWSSPLPRDVIATVCARTQWHQDRIEPTACSQLGVLAVFRSQRVNYQKSLYFSHAQSI